MQNKSEQDNKATPSPLPPASLLPPLEGEISVQYVRCGKTPCRCQTGQLHGPYYYRIWRQGAQIRKIYVKATELEAVRAACAAHKNLLRSLRDVKTGMSVHTGDKVAKAPPGSRANH